MYSILISLLVGALVGALYTLLGFWKTWAMGIILGVVLGLATFVLISRILAKRFEPRFMHAQKQLQSGATALAMQTLTAEEWAKKCGVTANSPDCMGGGTAKSG